MIIKRGVLALNARLVIGDRQMVVVGDNARLGNGSAKSKRLTNVQIHAGHMPLELDRRIGSRVDPGDIEANVGESHGVEVEILITGLIVCTRAPEVAYKDAGAEFLKPLILNLGKLVPTAGWF